MAQASTNDIIYSGSYIDGNYEYLHVTLPAAILASIADSELVSEEKLWLLGVRPGLGWKHYAINRPEPNILLFRRALGTDPTTGLVDPARLLATQQAFQRQLYNSRG